MTVENTTTIDGLDITLPRDSDLRVEGDNHLRQLKIIDKTMFPGFGGDGFNKPITATESDLNFLQNIASNIEVQLQDLRNGEVGIGMIQFFTGSIISVPARFFLCDGANGTPDLLDSFVLGAGSEGTLNDTGGFNDDVIVTHTHNADHNHTGSSANAGVHTHTIQPFGNDSGGFISTFRTNRNASTVAAALASGDHQHSAITTAGTVNTANTGVSPIGTNIPKFYKAAYIMRVS